MCPLLQAVWSLALMLPHLTAAPKSCWTLRIRWVIANNGCRSVQRDVHVQLSFRSSIKSETSISPTSLAISVRKQGICRPRMMWGFCQPLLLRWLTIVMLKAVIPSAEASGDGHQANEGVCVRRTQRLKTGAPAAQHAWVLLLFTKELWSDVHFSLSGVFFRHQCQWVHNEDENESGLSGAPEDRAL